MAPRAAKTKLKTTEDNAVVISTPKPTKKRVRRSEQPQTAESLLENGLTKSGLTKLIRMANIDRNTRNVYKDLRTICRVWLDVVLHKAAVYRTYNKRNTVSRNHIDMALKSVSHRIY